MEESKEEDISFNKSFTAQSSIPVKLVTPTLFDNRSSAEEEGSLL